MFTLASALRLYDAFGAEIGAFETQLLAELAALEPPTRRAEPVPAHPNRAKEHGLRRRGEQAICTALWRVAGVDFTRIDGISTRVAQVVVTEVGPNLAAVPSEDDFVSWLRLRPRTPISGGKPLKKRRDGLGVNRIAAVLRIAATTVRRSQTALGASFRRLARRKGAAVSIFATARQLAKLIYRMLRFGQDYVDVGAQAMNVASSCAASPGSPRPPSPSDLFSFRRQPNRPRGKFQVRKF